MNKIIDDNGRTCSACKKYKAWSEFGKMKHGVNGRHSHCSQCRRDHEAAKRGSAPELTQARLKHLIHYDPETGEFVWRLSNKPAGCIQTNGYLRIRIDGKYYLAQRLAFLYMTGKYPDVDTDHTNRDRSDNCWENLRAVTRSENMMNKGPNVHGLPQGIQLQEKARGPKWKVTYKHKYLGTFDNLFDAACARKKVEKST